MGILTEPDRIRIFDGLQVVFDTQEGLFHGTDEVSGSITLPKRTARVTIPPGETAKVSPINRDNERTLRSIHDDADVVVGAFRVRTNGGNQGLNDLGWFSASGTYVHLWDGIALAGENLGDNHYSTQRAAFTLLAKDGKLKLHERITLDASRVGQGSTYELLEMVFDYKLFCGTFT